MICISISSFIGVPTKKICQLKTHQLSQISANIVSDVCTNHFKNLLRLALNLLEETYNFWYAYFHFHKLH